MTSRLNSRSWAWAANLTRNPAPVKPAKAKYSYYSAIVSGLLGALLLALTPPVLADTPRELAVLNATTISNTLHSVVPDKLLKVVTRIAKNEIPRVAPDQPIWILEIIDGTILHYQGQPAFDRQDASKLVDDNGFRFGQRAVERAKASQSGWLSLVLGGERYLAFCAAKYPTVVCSLVP